MLRKLFNKQITMFIFIANLLLIILQIFYYLWNIQIKIYNLNF